MNKPGKAEKILFSEATQKEKAYSLKSSQINIYPYSKTYFNSL